MAIGSLVAAASTSFLGLLVGRAIQGLQAGALPLGISLVASVVPEEKQASSIALVSGTLGVGGALGLPLAGVITQATSYHVLFWITFGFSAAALAGVLVGVPEGEIAGRGQLDVPGSVVLGLTLLALLLPLSEGAVWGWASPMVWGLVVVAIVLAVVFGRMQLRRTDPLVDVRALALRPVLLTDVASILIGFSMFGSILGTSSYVEAPSATGYGFGSSVAAAGLTLLPSGLAMLLVAPVAGAMIRRRGARLTLAVGCLVVAAGWLTRILLTSSLAWVVIGTTVVGIGVALCFAAFPAIINRSVPADQNAAANGLNALFRSLGTSLVSALCGSVLASLTMLVDGVTLPTLAAYRWVFAICLTGALVACVLAVLIPEDEPQRA